MTTTCAASVYRFHAVVLTTCTVASWLEADATRAMRISGSGPTSGRPRRPPAGAAYMRARLRALLIPPDAPISAACAARESLSPGVV